MFGKTDLLEDNFREPYDTWKKDPTPENNANILNTLHPTIEGAIKTHVGASNPLLLSRARLLALEGLKSYDPKRGRLQTHLYNHLQGLKRVNRQQTTILKVPERIALDRYNLENAVSELSNKLGREPTDTEIADHTGFSTKRIAKTRAYNPAVAEGTIDMATMGGGPTGGVQGRQTEQPVFWDLVHSDLDPYHQQVMEYSLGMNNKPVLSNQRLAAKLKRSPGAISQAKLRIQKLLDEMEELSQNTI